MDRRSVKKDKKSIKNQKKVKIILTNAINDGIFNYVNVFTGD